MQYTRSITSIIKMMKRRYKNLIVESCQDSACECYFLSISPNGSDTNTVFFDDENILLAMKSIRECSVSRVRMDITDMNLELIKDSICLCEVCKRKNIRVYIPPISRWRFRFRFYNGTYNQHITILRDLLRNIQKIVEKYDHVGIQLGLEKRD